MRSLLPLLSFLLLGVAARAQDPEYNKFIQAFDRAMGYDDQRGMEQAVRSAPKYALRHFAALCWTWKYKQDDSNRETLDALKTAWQGAYGTGTLEKYERFILSRSRRDHDTIREADEALNKSYRALEDAKRHKHRPDFEALRQGVMNIARAYETTGHRLAAADAWTLVSAINAAIPQQTVQDRRDAVYAMERFVEHRKSWEWTEDAFYKQNLSWLRTEKARLAELEKLAKKREEAGYEEGVAGVDALVMPDVEEQVLPLEYETQKRAPEDMFVRGGAIPPLWLATKIEGEGPAPMTWFRAEDLYLVRPGHLKFGITRTGTEPDLDRIEWQPIETSTKYEPTEFFVDDQKTRRYAMWFFVGGQQQPLMGMTSNLAPQKETATVFYKSAASWKTEINDETVTFYDDNGNGKLFEADPFAAGVQFSTQGDPNERVTVPAYDTMKIGRGDRRPWSAFVEIDEQWFHLRAKDDGTKVGVRPLNPEFFKTGEVEFEWKGPRKAEPSFLIIRGKGTFAQANFDIVSRKPVEVPVGRYDVTYGRITTGRRARTIEAHVFKGDTDSFEVEEGETTTITLGAPFRIDFEKGGSGDTVTIDSLTFRVLGRSGELYARINGATPTPDVLACRTNTGRGAKTIGEFVQMNPDQYDKLANRYPNLGTEVGFFPVAEGNAEGSTKLEARLPFPDAFVGLRQRKHKLFGKLEPIWKK